MITLQSGVGIALCSLLSQEVETRKGKSPANTNTLGQIGKVMILNRLNPDRYPQPHRRLIIQIPYTGISLNHMSGNSQTDASSVDLTASNDLPQPSSAVLG